MGKKKYADNISTNLPEKEAKKKLTPSDFKAVEQCSELDMTIQEEQMKLVGEIGWTSNVDPNLTFPFAAISRTNSKPNLKSLLLAKRIAEYAKRIHKPLKFVGNVRVPVILAWCDANYQINQADSRLGYIIQLVDKSEVFVNGVFTPSSAPHHNFVAWRSMKPGRAVGSSSIAELLALREVVKAVPLYTSIITTLWRKVPDEYYLTDNQAVIDWCHSRWMQSDSQWQGVLNQVLSDLGSDERKTELRWVPTNQQRADKLTKFISAE